MPGKHFWLALVFAAGLNAGTLYAEEPVVDEDVAATLEFLEFLGEWETNDGDWVGPEELEQIETIDQEQGENEKQ